MSLHYNHYNQTPTAPFPDEHHFTKYRITVAWATLAEMRLQSVKGCLPSLSGSFSCERSLLWQVSIITVISWPPVLQHNYPAPSWSELHQLLVKDPLPLALNRAKKDFELEQKIGLDVPFPATHGV